MIGLNRLPSRRGFLRQKRSVRGRARHRFLYLLFAVSKSHLRIRQRCLRSHFGKFSRFTAKTPRYWKAIAFDDDDYFESEKDRILRPPVSVENDSSNNRPTSADNKTSDDASTVKSSSTETIDDDKLSGDGVLYDFLYELDRGMPKSWYYKALWLWERPVMKLGRLTVFFAQLPVVFTFLTSKIGFLVGQITLPMLPPLLLGAGILLRSIWVNAGHLFPRVCLTMLLFWGIWFLNSLIFRTISHLTKQGTVSRSTAHHIMNWTEGLTLVTAGLVMLSLFGVNISGLLLPAGICLALAAKDLAHNFLAGLVLFLAQPFRVGDSVSVRPTIEKRGPQWYEGICERIDLRYTILRKGRYKLHVPNASFITREFLVMDRSREHREEKDNPLIRKEEDSIQCPGSPGRNANTEAQTNGTSLDLEDMPSAADYPSNELYIEETDSGAD